MICRATGAEGAAAGCTAVVPRPAKAGSLVIRSRLLDHTGVFMPRMMNPEEMAMMQAVEVYKD